MYVFHIKFSLCHLSKQANERASERTEKREYAQETQAKWYTQWIWWTFLHTQQPKSWRKTISNVKYGTFLLAWISTIGGDFFMIEHLRVTTILCAVLFLWNYVFFCYFFLSVVIWLPVYCSMQEMLPAETVYLIIDVLFGLHKAFHSVYYLILLSVSHTKIRSKKKLLLRS